ncbi:MAG: ATP synthase F1 subunit delta [Myxococcota bacterium]
MALLEKPIARRWARAMLELAEEKKALAEVGADLDALADAIRKSKDLAHVVASPAFRVEQRRAVLMAVADGGEKKAHQLTRLFLNLLVDKGRLTYLPLIADAFRVEADRRLGRVRAEVHSATPLTKEELEGIAAALKEQAVKRQLGREVLVTANVDPALLAGVRARLGGLVFDGTLKNHLRRIGAELTQNA